MYSCSILLSKTSLVLMTIAKFYVIECKLLLLKFLPVVSCNFVTFAQKVFIHALEALSGDLSKKLLLLVQYEYLLKLGEHNT